ncbi:contact-dependent growth inhibition system immunity protein [Ideonella sp. DXS29W]|uniref:Contact-dependent growth inhibition system immunity protein n=1 Tax=Ideonella lacteola TaxID=2984193 RepID=A0ABU9BZ59_9BURK
MNTSRTLEQLEGHPWPPPPSDATPLMARCHALRKVPIATLSAGDCRLLIGQDVGARHLVPLALNFAEAEPLLDSDYYPGDLLLSLLGVGAEYWSQHRDQYRRLLAVARQAKSALAQAHEPFSSDRKLRKEIDAFLAQDTAA